jgi:hypothetical protein
VTASSRARLSETYSSLTGDIIVSSYTSHVKLHDLLSFCSLANDTLVPSLLLCWVVPLDGPRLRTGEFLRPSMSSTSHLSRHHEVDTALATLATGHGTSHFLQFTV